MEFKVNGKRHALRGATTQNIKAVAKQNFIKAMEEGVHFSMLQLCTTNTGIFQALTVQAETPPLQATTESLLAEFDDIFHIPKEVPPFRPKFDHNVSLIQGANPINKRPYRCAKSQNDIIDKLVQDYLKDGVIQHSLYASPVVLVGKKMVLGDYVWIIGILTKIKLRKDFLFHPWMTSYMNYMGLQFRD